jgi:hypothetical protein
MYTHVQETHAMQLYYVLGLQASGKANALSLRDRQEPCQYYQYWAIPKYEKFYGVYAKSAMGMLCS